MSVTRHAKGEDVWDLFDVSWNPDSRGLTATLASLLDRCAAWFRADGASLFLYDEQEQAYVLRAKSGLEERAPDGAVIDTDHGIAATCVRLHKPLLVTNPDEHPLLANARVRRRPEIGSAMVIPLCSRSGQSLGVLNISRGAGAPIFATADLRAAASFASFVSLAVANATLMNRNAEAIAQAKKAQQDLQDVIQALGVAVVVVDGFLRVTHANPQALLLLGGKELDTRSGERNQALMKGIQASLQKALRGEHVRDTISDPADGRCWTVACTPLHGGGATAAIEDITEHERNQQEMARISRLADIGQMTAAIAHEIRNPLTAILGAAELMHTPDNPKLEIVEIIESETIKLNNLCDEFLEFARPLVLRSQEAKLSVLARAMVAQCQRDFDDAGVQLNLQVRPSEPTILIDTHRVEQVLRNLLINALQACQAGDVVNLEVGSGWFKVEDTGKGMNEEQKRRLFTPFFTTKPNGTGLGLSNTRKIVDAHGGEIKVEAREGRGSIFWVNLGEGEAA